MLTESRLSTMQITPLRTGTQLHALRQKPQWGTFLPALAAGLAAAGLAFLLVRSHTPADAAAPASVLVVVAARDLPARTRLTSALLTVRAIAPADIPEGAAKTPEVFVGKISLRPIAAGGALTKSLVSAPSAALGMAFALPPNLRAVTVATDPADGVELFVRPEDHVDILATDEPGSGPAEARTVLQNVRLLAVGGSVSPDPPPSASNAQTSGAAHVTVAVTPIQAQALVLAAARGRLHLALRAIGDGDESSIPALPAPVLAPSLPKPRSHPRPVLPEVILPLPPIAPMKFKIQPPAQVSVVVIKGTVSQTVTVAP